ncbi:MAG TPA: hydantoinase/oxoprolinase family protein [Gaiellaceae bacterium]|jgi:N-methylhydantoinase A/oxoprolinase/acetone carboxylase beta subunit|nr:hydantoinase/oxoprolinase family protein [Gaiellaceae bacterium]
MTAYAVGIDTGGTFTDAFVSAGDEGVSTVKVETTPHDLTVCFAEAIDASARSVGLDRREFLRQAEIVRFSSTIATNTVVTRSGPKLGLVVRRGAEEGLYGAAAGETIFDFVPREMITGIGWPPDEEEVGAAVRRLLEQGARLLVVSLPNAEGEREVKQIVDRSYPRHYLGAVPILLSGEISATANDAERTAAAVVNAYLHKRLATSLYKAEDDLRRDGFRHPLLVVTTDGAVTRVAKTRALSTYQSGPTSGIHGSALLCAALGLDAAITADVGGTSTDVGVIAGGRPVHRETIDVGGLPLAQPSVELVSFGIGGGSLARVEHGRVRVGPESAGAAPGPAAFGLGGREPTPTDAWLLLGYLDPTFYLGGRKRLNTDLARRALEERIAGPLGVSVEAAALLVKEAAEEAVVDGVRGLPGAAGASALVAYGGGGGILMPAVAARLGVATTILSRFSPVFSAFGVSTFDVRHTYEARGGDEAVARLREAAVRDMRGEGFDPDAIHFEIEREDGIVRLSATCSVPKPPLPEEPEGAGEDPAQASKGEREIVLPAGRTSVLVYERLRLRAGHAFAGPALVEASDTTYLVPPGARCRIDRFGNAVLTEAG